MIGWTDDPNTDTDDKLVLAKAKNDLISTLSGSGVALIGSLAPFIIAFSPASDNVKMAAIANGAITGGAGAAIARQKP